MIREWGAAVWLLLFGSEADDLPGFTPLSRGGLLTEDGARLVREGGGRILIE